MPAILTLTSAARATPVKLSKAVALVDVLEAMAGNHSPYAFTTPERDRRYLSGYVPDATVRARLRAGIEEFRRMLERVSCSPEREEVDNGPA
jgi:hypothetical protein